MGDGSANGNGGGNGGAHFPLLGGALGPVAKSIIDASAVLPVLKEVMKFAEVEQLKQTITQMGDGPR